MTPSEMDALDRVCNLAMGYTYKDTENFSGKPVVSIYDPSGKWVPDEPSPTRDPAAFVALLRWLAEKDIHLQMGKVIYPATPKRWEAFVCDVMDETPCADLYQTADDPQIALCLAVRAWKEAK